MALLGPRAAGVGIRVCVRVSTEQLPTHYMHSYLNAGVFFIIEPSDARPHLVQSELSSLRTCTLWALSGLWSTPKKTLKLLARGRTTNA